MIRKKGSFFTFCFSLLPGAGEMYMGFMKKGISIMALFFLSIFVASFLSSGPLLFIIPIIWFYSFFNVHNIRGLADDEFYALEDDYIFHIENLLPDSLRVSIKAQKILAFIFIIMGASILWQNMLSLITYFLPSYISDIIYTFGHKLPQTIIALALIYFGYRLIIGKKKQIENNDEINLHKDGDIL